MKRILLLTAAAALLVASPATAKSKAKRGKKAAPAKAAPAKSGASKADVIKPIKRLIGAVRYGKNAMALKQFDGPGQARFMLTGHGKKLTDAQTTEFIKLFHQMFATIAFPKVRKDFQKLETILYDEPRIRGSKAKVGTTIVILHPVKKQEIKATFDLSRVGTAWQVVDVQVKGDKSMLTNIRVEQVGPILKEGGPDHLLGLMRKRVASMKKR